MAKKRDDFLINLLITSQNLAEGPLNDFGEQLEELEQKIRNLQQSENRRTDTVRSAQKADAEYSKQTEKIIDQSKESVKANEKETKSILNKVEAIDEQGFSYSVFAKNLTRSFDEVKRKLEVQKLDIDTTALKSSISEVEQAIVNLDAAYRRKGLTSEQKDRIEEQRAILFAERESLAIELENLSIRKSAIRDQQAQLKVEEEIVKKREQSETLERRRLALQTQALKLDRQVADVPRKRAEATRKLLTLLEKEEDIKARASTNDTLAIARLKEWEEQIESTKRQLEDFGATQQDIATIENNASRSKADRDLKLAEARNKYAKAIAEENKINSQSIAKTGEQITKLEVLRERKEILRKEIELLGGSYESLNRISNKSTNNTEKNITTVSKLRGILGRFTQGAETGPISGFFIAFRRAGDEASVLARSLGRLGLAIRGLVIVGLLAFMQSFVSVLGAAGAQLTALIGSILSAAAALGISLVSAVGQAIPAIGLLAAAFSRFSAIQEAVGQADLAQKQSFGDTSDQQAATDAALQIAEAQRAVKEAQEGVNEARREAKKELEELILKEKEAELAFKGATLSQLEARRALRATIESGDVESVARDQLGVQESGLDVVRARRELRGARVARREGQAGGVKGTETYKNAIDALANAQRNLAQAQRSAASSADTQSAAERNLAFFLNELSDVERKIFKQFMRIRERYTKVFRPITDIILVSFSRGIERAEKLLFSSQIVSGFRTLSNAISGSFDKIAKVLTGPEFKAFFVEMLSQAAKNMPLITDGFIILAHIFKNIALTAGPAFREILEFIVEKLAEFNEKVSDTNSFSDFLMMGVEHFKAWINLIGAILGLFGELMQASSGSALETLSSLTDTINNAKESLRADDSGARNFFDDAAESAKFIGDVIVELGKAIIELTSSKQVKALADIFTEALIPGIVSGIKVIGAFALFLDKLLENAVFAKIFQLGIAFFFVGSAVKSVTAIFKPFLVFFAGISRAFQLLGKSIGKFIANLKIFNSATEAISKAWFFSNKPTGMIGIIKSIPQAIKNAGGFFMVLRKGLAAIPGVGLVVAAVIEVVIGAITALIENFGGIRDYVVEQFTGLLGDLGGLGDSIGKLFESIFGEGAFKGFLGILGDIATAIFKVIGFIGKLAGALAIMAIVNAIIVPLRLVINILSTIIEYIANVINAFKSLFSGEISFTEFISQIWSAVKGLIGGILGSLGNAIKSIFMGLGNIVFAALREALNAIFGERFGAEIINTVIDIVNWVIDRINEVSPFGDIDKLDKVSPEENQSPASKSDSAGRGRAREIDAETDAQKKNNKAKKDASKFSLDNYAALNLSGGASKKNTRLNNELADSLGRSSRQHKRAQNLQEALAESAGRSRKQQERYAESVRQTARVEERYANSLARARKIKNDTNDKDRASVRIRENLADATKNVSRIQSKYYNSTIKSAAASQIFNRNIKSGNNLQQKYAKYLDNASDATTDQRKATSKLIRRLGSLNKVLQVTGENSRALGSVFKRVTNRLLTEFNVAPLKVQLPSVSGMFKQAMGDAQGFQRGGYFGQKGMRGPDDRTIMVAGGEAILTGNHQAAVDTAFSIANQTAGFPYQNLDSMFNRDKRPHASAKKFNRGGRVGGGRNSIVLPRSVPDADGALPGLDLMAFLLNKYFGLSLTDGLRNSNYGSDHEWGGAIDVSNGSSPTPQMDSAWFWLTKVLGGAKASGFIENYTSGAIKQMLYRTDIGGNHFNHIHLALTDAYARDIEALTKILTGEAVPIATGGMFAAAPQLKKPKIRTNNDGSIKSLMQAQSDMLTKGANKLLSKKIVPASGGLSYAPTTAAIDPGTKIKTGFTVYDDAPPGSFGALDDGYAELGTATASGLTGGGYMAQAFGLAGELPENFPVDVQINGRTKRLYKRDRGWGQGTSDYGIDIWQDSWGFFGLNANSSGQAIVTAANKGKKKGKPGPQYNLGGKIPEFDDGGIVPGPIGAPRLIKAHGGETILPTHKYNSGGMVPRYQSGGRTDGIVSVTSYADVRNTTSQKINQQIKKVQNKLKNAEKAGQKAYLSEKLKELKDRLLLSNDLKELNQEIKDINKDIKDTNKKLKTAEGDEAKRLNKKLKELNKDLREAKSDRKATVAFEGETYNTNLINEFILLISDRLNSFIKKIDEEVTRLASATAMWTYKIMRVNGKKIVSRVNSAVSEAQRGLADLVKETGLIAAAIKETRNAERKARRKIRKTRIKFRKDEAKLLNELEKAETKEAKKRIREELADLRKGKKEDTQKLQASIKNSQNKRKELLQRQAENLAARYDAQNAVFEERMAVFDSNLSMMDTRIEIATLQNQDDKGELTEAGKAAVKAIYNERGAELSKARKVIEAQLAQAKKSKDIERQRELNQALLDNQLALLQNTQSIKELDDTVGSIFDFQSTNWQMFRKAIFTGNGPQVLPQFNSAIPQLATGGYISREGLAYLHAAEVVVPASSQTRNTGPLVDTINFTQPMEVADPVAISNTIGFKLSTLKSI